MDCGYIFSLLWLFQETGCSESLSNCTKNAWNNFEALLVSQRTAASSQGTIPSFYTFPSVARAWEQWMKNVAHASSIMRKRQPRKCFLFCKGIIILARILPNNKTSCGCMLISVCGVWEEIIVLAQRMKLRKKYTHEYNRCSSAAEWGKGNYSQIKSGQVVSHVLKTILTLILCK